MILQKLVWEILSKDDTDDNALNKQALLSSLFPDISDFSQLNYYWLSLKTLLKDASNEWAFNKIKYLQEINTEFQTEISNDDLPLIQINQTQDYVQKSTNLLTNESEICVSIYSKKNLDPLVESNSNETFFIYKRIKEFLFPLQRNNTRLVFCKKFNNLGIANLTLNYDRSGIGTMREWKMYFKIKVLEI